MANDIVKPKQDVVFKKMFADEKNKELLIDLISSLLDLPNEAVKDAKVLNPEITPESIKEKFPRLDILVSTQDRMMDLEMQTTDSEDFLDRALIYWAKMCAQDLEKGASYSTLRQNVSISILDFHHAKFSHSDYASLFKLYDTDHRVTLTKKCVFLFFELHNLRKLNKTISQFDRKELWLKLLNSESKEDLDMIRELNNPVMNKAVGVVNDMSNDPRIRELVRQREYAEHEEASRVHEAMKKTRAEDKANLIKGLRAKGMEEAAINEIVRLMESGDPDLSQDTHSESAELPNKKPPAHGKGKHR